MVGWERYERLHIGTYIGFGIDYMVAAAALPLGCRPCAISPSSSSTRRRQWGATRNAMP